MGFWKGIIVTEKARAECHCKRKRKSEGARRKPGKSNVSHAKERSFMNVLEAN